MGYQPGQDPPPEYSGASSPGVQPANPAVDNRPGFSGGFYPVVPPPQPFIYAPVLQQQQQQQQQQSVVVINNTARVYTYAAHKSLACFTAWLCNPLFGLVGYILAGNFNF